MRDLLFLAHRIPYPPDKGDKIRSWHFLKFLTQHYRVHLGCFVDDDRDWQFEKFLRGICGECCFVKLHRSRAQWRSMRALLHGDPLTLPYYYDGELDQWVRDIVKRRSPASIFIYSSAMAQYVMRDDCTTLRRVMDFVDVDSEKWSDYAKRMSWPKSWIYGREGRLLRQWERQVAAVFENVLLCTSAEADLFRDIAPGSAARVNNVPNGVDCEYFSPDRHYPNPYQADRTVLTFTGAMDYWANVDAVQFFVASVLPQLRQRIPDVCFFIVGSNPTAEVRSLANNVDVVVTGRVPDVRPYVAHARAVVVPLRIARGIQNKVLEGMAMAKPVVVSPQALEGIKAEAGAEILVAEGANAFADVLYALANGKVAPNLGANARKRILKEWQWSASLQQLSAFVDA